MTDPERSSISSGFNVPQWIRSKTDRNDYDVNFSPPTHDDSFFYIRYPVQENSTTNIKKLSEKLHKESRSHHFNASKTGHFSNHTEPCKKFMNETNKEDIKHPPKSFGTDDGFHGANAACGSSLIQVAQRMVSGRSYNGSKGFQTNVDQEEIDSLQLKTVEDQTLKTSSLIQPEPYELEAQKSKSRLIRRGSKSLPASPAGSPKSTRKYQPNPFFTGTFVPANVNSEVKSWFLSSLLGIQREATPSSSVHQIDEEPEHLNNNININPNDNLNEFHKKVMKAKPSELREMNFWSPTSM